MSADDSARDVDTWTPGERDQWMTIVLECVTGRLLRLESVTIAPSAAGFPQMQAQIGAATYIVPPVEPLSDAAAAPAPSESGTTPSTTNATVGAAQ